MPEGKIKITSKTDREAGESLRPDYISDNNLMNIKRDLITKYSANDNGGSFIIQSRNKTRINNKMVESHKINLKLDTASQIINAINAYMGIAPQNAQSPLNNLNKYTFINKSKLLGDQSLKGLIKENYNNYLFKNLDLKKKKRGVGKIKLMNMIKSKDNNKVINPKTKRKITIGKRTFKSIFGNIKIKKIYYNQLSTHKTLDYEVINNCGLEFLNNIMKIKVSSYDYFTVNEFINICNSNNKNIAVYTSSDILYYENTLKGKLYNFVVTDEHLYHVNLSANKKKIEKKVLNNIEELENTKDVVYYTGDCDLFNGLCERLNNVSSNEVIYNSNKVIYCNVGHDKMPNIRSKNFYTYMNKEDKLNLCNSCVNSDVESVLQNISKIRSICKGGECTNFYDHNKSYPSHMRLHSAFGEVKYESNFKKYVSTHVINNSNLYYIEVKNTDDILAPKSKDYFFGYLLKKPYFKKRIKKIYSYLPIIEFQISSETVKEFTNNELRAYSGWIQCKNIENTCKVNTSSKLEIEALEILHKNITNYNEEDRALYISKNRMKPKTGLHNALLLWELTNIKLYEFHNEFMKKNPTAELIRIKTDSVGYKCKTKPKMKVTDEIGGFKEEKKECFYYDEIINDDILISAPVIHKPQKINNYDLSDYKELLGQDFSILCPAGFGKSYFIKNEFIPYIKNNGYDAVFLGTTRNSSDDITFQKYSKKYYQDINLNLKTYLIIDEISQMNKEGFKIIENYKKYFNCKILLMGDIEQCKLEYDLNYKNIINMLTSYNTLTIPYRDGISRYSKELYNVLNKVLTAPIDKIINIVKSNFKITNKIDEKNNFSYTHAYGRKKLNGLYNTIHSVQGQTINESYTIHEIEKAPRDVIYTALSRAKNLEQIKIYSF